MSKGGSDFHNLSASQVIEEKFSELSLFSVSNGDLIFWGSIPNFV